METSFRGVSRLSLATPAVFSHQDSGFNDTSPLCTVVAYITITLYVDTYVFRNTIHFDAKAVNFGNIFERRKQG